MEKHPPGCDKPLHDWWKECIGIPRVDGKYYSIHYYQGHNEPSNQGWCLIKSGFYQGYHLLQPTTSMASSFIWGKCLLKSGVYSCKYGRFVFTLHVLSITKFIYTRVRLWWCLLFIIRTYTCRIVLPMVDLHPVLTCSRIGNYWEQRRRMDTPQLSSQGS